MGGSCYVQSCYIREEISSLGETFVSGNNDRIEHGFVQQKVSHPLRDDNVYFLIQGQVLYSVLNDSDLILAVILSYDSFGQFGQGGGLDGQDHFGSSLGAEQREYPCASANVHGLLSSKNLRVVDDGVTVALSPDPILDHCLVNVHFGVGVKVVVLARLLGLLDLLVKKLPKIHYL